MNYRLTQEFKPPFRINALIEEAGLLKVGDAYFSIDIFFGCPLYNSFCTNLTLG